MTTLAVLQPSYLPWLGCFDQINRSNFFIFYDDVQFEKNSWRNRNRVKGSSGCIWLSVPILQKGRMGQLILDVEIDKRQNWARKHIGTLQQAYARAPYRKLYLDEFEAILMRPWTHLVALDIELTTKMCEWLGIRTPLYRSSELGIAGRGSERLLNFCNHFNADCYLSGDSAQAYLDLPLFQKNEIKVEWQNYDHPHYAQLHGAFTPYMSALDLLMNVGPDSLAVLEEGALNARR